MIWCIEDSASERVSKNYYRHRLTISCKCSFTRISDRYRFLRQGGKCPRCQPRAMSGPDNPMYGKKRPDLAERNRKNPRKGKMNPMYGRSRPDLSERCRKFWEEVRAGMRKNPVRGRRMPGKGRIYLYNSTEYRSRWEVLIAILLERFNLTVKYEGVTFPLLIDGKVRKYTPDFWIEELDLAIEVKGWLYDETQKKRLVDFEERYGGPGGYLVIGIREMKELGFISRGTELSKYALEILELAGVRRIK